MAAASEQLRVWVNGEPRGVAQGGSIADLLAELGLPADRVAVELDRRIVRRARWGRTLLADGARVEIVHFVGGG